MRPRDRRDPAVGLVVKAGHGGFYRLRYADMNVSPRAYRSWELEETRFEASTDR